MHVDSLSEQLSSFMQQLPHVPDELHVVKYEASMLDIEPDWTRFVGDSFAQVALHRHMAS